MGRDLFLVKRAEALSVRTIADPGSCHDGDMYKALRLIDLAADAGIDAVKWQLLTPAECKGGNVSISWEWFPELIVHGKTKGIEVFASVFDRSGWDYVIQCGCKSVKLSYSQAHKLNEYPHKSPLETIYISRDVMSPILSLWPVIPKNPPRPNMNLIRMYCLPLYPIPYMIDFEGLFDGPSPRFHGFSSHALGIQQEIRAAEAGAKYLEFHMGGDWTSNTPDGKFSKSPAMVEKICKAVKK